MVVKLMAISGSAYTPLIFSNTPFFKHLSRAVSPYINFDLIDMWIVGVGRP